MFSEGAEQVKPNQGILHLIAEHRMINYKRDHVDDAYKTIK